MAVASRTPRMRRADCTGPGIRRVRHGRGFRYVDPDGEGVTDDEVVARINELVVPPAWQEVWICPYPGGHIQASGVDQAGRKQYLYHPRCASAATRRSSTTWSASPARSPHCASASKASWKRAT